MLGPQFGWDLPPGVCDRDLEDRPSQEEIDDLRMVLEDIALSPLEVIAAAEDGGEDGIEFARRRA